ncbi:hypothetical protein NQ317_018128 [Molorchus minor]|uniref:Uncharacterized protein n=1 Tax=Molorchus minor TaxID=1323400 RepID=A0ABQ9IUL6_9CUCU|nr:hypothetical protein NQ317_018128 [Molorchus minor]
MNIKNIKSCPEWGGYLLEIAINSINSARCPKLTTNVRCLRPTLSVVFSPRWLLKLRAINSRRGYNTSGMK